MNLQFVLIFTKLKKNTIAWSKLQRIIKNALNFYFTVLVWTFFAKYCICLFCSLLTNHTEEQIKLYFVLNLRMKYLLQLQCYCFENNVFFTTAVHFFNH